jgi:hypothetical protein
MTTNEPVLTVRLSKRILLTVVAVSLMIGGTSIWYASLTPYQRCFTDTCQEREGELENKRIIAEYAPFLEAADRNVDRVDREMREQQQRIDQINQAIGDLCKKSPSSCAK